MKVIKPPHSISENHQRKNAVFLAGSIEMGKAEDWQQKLEIYFEQLDDYTVLNPRRDDWDSSWKQSIDNPLFKEQVSWELEGLEKATAIIMYLSPETKAPISLLELGLHADSKKMLVCCPQGYWRKGNVEIVCERYSIPFYEQMDQLLKHHFPIA